MNAFRLQYPKKPHTLFVIWNATWMPCLRLLWNYVWLESFLLVYNTLLLSWMIAAAGKSVGFSVWVRTHMAHTHTAAGHGEKQLVRRVSHLVITITKPCVVLAGWFGPQPASHIHNPHSQAQLASAMQNTQQTPTRNLPFDFHTTHDSIDFVVCWLRMEVPLGRARLLVLGEWWLALVDQLCRTIIEVCLAMLAILSGFAIICIKLYKHNLQRSLEIEIVTSTEDILHNDVLLSGVTTNAR